MTKGSNPIPKPAVVEYGAGFGDPLQAGQLFEESAKTIMASMFEGKDRIPFYSTGARALLKVGGKAIGVCQSFKWSVSYNATPIQTIDTPHAWDIDVGVVSISANMSQIMDPTKGPEHDGLFHIMNAAVHQPMVELQVLDKSGTSIFFARGMFTSVSGGVQVGAMSTWNAGFVGVAYQHYVSQQFKPYNSIAGALGNLVDELGGLASDLSGGFL